MIGLLWLGFAAAIILLAVNALRVGINRKQSKSDRSIDAPEFSRTLPLAPHIAAGQSDEQSEKRGSFGARRLATPNEQSMYWRLVEALPMPDYVVLVQVSFGAMLRAKDGASRYSFAQKRADFVVLNRGFRVLAVVELDDASHKGREGKDADRDAMLLQAGYRVVRYTRIPDTQQLRADIAR